MMKWYEDLRTDTGVVVSSRVRLARNLKKYPFSPKLSPEDAKALCEDVKNAFLNDRNPLAQQFTYVDLTGQTPEQTEKLVEAHSISPALAQKTGARGLLLNQDETISILVNEEDHLRIQVILPGEGLDAAFDMADKLDALLEETLDYAFDKDFGYLTACPTNVGTGMRASYMLHLPALEMNGQIRSLAQNVAKFGMTVRGSYGEGSEALGSLYQLSNQITLGQSEEELLNNLKKVLAAVIKQEEEARNQILQQRRDEAADLVGRSYGILSYAGKLTSQEAAQYLGNVRTGLLWGLLPQELHPRKTLCQLLIESQPGTMLARDKNAQNPYKRDALRAAYLREQFQH